MDDAIIQEISWDTDTRKIEVSHMINLESLTNAEWQGSTKHRPGELIFNQICDECDVEREKFQLVTLFTYRKFSDNNFPNEHAVKFPESGENYPLSELNHLVVVKMEEDQVGGSISKTFSQALEE